MLLFLMAALFALACEGGAAKTKPHVWLIVADDLGFGDLGYTSRSTLLLPAFCTATVAVVLVRNRVLNHRNETWYHTIPYHTIPYHTIPW